MTRNVIRTLAGQWRKEERGNIAMITALSIIPILSIVGVAIDAQVTMTQKSKVQSIIDSAVIFGSRAMQAGSPRTEVATDVNAYVRALLREQSTSLSCTGVTLEFTDGTQDLDANIFCSQPTTLSNLFGQTKMDFRVSSGSTYGIGKVEIAFIFDVSGSMGSSGKMGDLKDAAREAVDTLMPDNSNLANPDDVRIAMVSYDTMVNAGDYFTAVTGKNKKRTETATKTEWQQVCQGWNRKGTKCNGGYKWEEVEVSDSVQANNTCVQERIGDEAFTDAAPGAGQWLESGGADLNRYGNASARSCNSIGPLPLTSRKSDLEDYIDDLNDYSSTAGHMGVAWGWYLLAPTWSSVWPAGSKPLPYDEPDAAKAMILMTDGEFNKAFAPSSQGNSFEQAQKQCDAVKATGIVIYTVAFKAPQQGKDILNYCATSAAHAFNPENGQELTEAYSLIAQSISDLRITY
ncbi:pilus assembly protein [Hyphomonas johnsonii]|nr:pilus assembly protein [Hyphomonas johnsonii]